MIGIGLLLLTLGIALGALFSGSETGFYRASRIRLVLDALDGDLVSRGLAVLTNHPALYLATSLVGNNLAHYVVSLATVLTVQAATGGASHWGELAASLVLTPLVFVYGELVPKNFFLHAPNRLLRAVGPVYLVFVVLFLPAAALLWAIDLLCSRLAKETPERVRLAIARRELRRVMEEGHEVGILHPAQRELAHGIFMLAKEPVAKYLTPLAEVVRARSDMTADEVLRLARRVQLPMIAVEETGPEKRLIGYLRVIDLKMQPDSELGPLRPLVDISSADTYIDALTRLHRARQSMGRVIDADGGTLGILTARRLRQPLFADET